MSPAARMVGPARGRGACAALAAAWLLGACAPVSRVILLPQDGHPGSQVVVSTAKGDMVIDRPYGVAEVGRSGRLSPDSTSAAEVAAEFPRLLALRPAAPERFILQFEPGTSQLTPDSQAQLDTVIARARERAGGEIVVIGHTDRQGTVEANDQLSMARAVAIRNILIAKGFLPELVQAVGRGEREPLVPTEDEVVEPRNRRAEVLVR